MYQIYGVTDVGVVRTNNEDGFVVNDRVIVDGEFQTELASSFIIAVADGLGGEKAGEVASSIVLEQCAHQSPMNSEEEVREFIEEKIQQQLFHHIKGHPETTGMGSTIAGINCLNDEMMIFHVGDSRVYRYRDDWLKPLTKDHSLVELLYDSGQIKQSEKFYHSERNILLRSLGQPAVEIECKRLPYPSKRKDIFLLCSDGLTNYVKDDEIEQYFQRKSNIKDTARSLLEIAKERGGADNITIVLIERIE
ncbi:protein phosphatase [Oikeobacillus pervagus]|uniref:Protein phosphatase n=1 Tax=Oikeobacillus pervagus TaxID=1325931 RepID=A0AAJ1T3L1_9BACI|nr:protein phosphatase 2C domain-containing protein [Oikeobacillus pervagus]MDQ0215289.1 protein phosphatase [Oikeobacillus pervagus]